MVDGVNKAGGPIEGQKFSQKGVKLSELKGNAPLFNYFKSKGLDENSFVYETDIQELLSKADKNGDGEFSRKEIKKGLGLEGSRKELKAAAKMLNKVGTTELADLEEGGLYPTRINENKTQYFDKKGTLVGQWQTDGKNQVYKQFEGGNTSLVSYSEVSDGEHTTFTETAFDKDGNPVKRKEYDENGNISLNREYAYKEGKLAVTTDHEGGKTIKTNYDEHERETRIETTEGNLTTVLENEYKGSKLAKQTVTGSPEQIRAGVKSEVVEFGDDGKAVKRAVTKNDGTVDEFEVKNGQEVPVVKPVTKENLDAGSKTKVTNAANPKGTIEGEVTKMERDEKTKEIKSFTLKSAASGNEFKYTYDPKTKHYVDQTGTKFYAMKDDGTLERNNKLNKAGGGAPLVLKEDAEKAKNKALAQAYAKDDLKTGDDDIKKAQNARIEADVKAGKVPGFTYDAEAKKIKSGADDKTIEDVRNHIQAQKDAVKAEQKEKSDKAKIAALVQAYAKDDLLTGDEDIKKAQNARILADVKAGKVPGYTYDKDAKMIKDSDGDESYIDSVRHFIREEKDSAKTERNEKSDKAKNKALAAAYASVDLKTGDEDLKKQQNARIEADVKAGKIPGFTYDKDAKKIKQGADDKTIDDVRNHIQAQKDAAKAERAETVDKAKMKGIVTKYARVDLTTADADKIKEQETMILDDVKKGKIPGFKYDETTKKITQTYTDPADNTVKTKEVTVSDVRAFIKDEKAKYVIKK